jgi:hypothetical protein
MSNWWKKSEWGRETNLVCAAVRSAKKLIAEGITENVLSRFFAKSRPPLLRALLTPDVVGKSWLWIFE